MSDFASPLAAVYVAILVLLLRFGQGLFIVGSVRSKNAAASAMRLLIDLAVVTLCLWAVGAAFVPHGEQGPLFTPYHLFGVDPLSRVAFGLLPTIVLATGAIHGALAERSRFVPTLLLAGGLAAFVVPILSFIDTNVLPQRNLSVFDAGAGLGSVIGGSVALVAALLVGPRKGKFNRDLSVNFVPGHNVSFQLFGLVVLTIAFTLLSQSVNVLLGVSSASLAGALFGRLRFGKVDTGLTISSAIAGLCAAATAGGPTWGGVLVGAVAGAVAPWLVIFVETRLRIDDVTGSITSHLVGGLLGYVGGALLYGPDTPMAVRFGTLAVNLGYAFVAIAVASSLTWGVFMLYRSRGGGGVRMTEGAEFDGADLSELDLNAYPDFQQTTIKSYHLREL